VGFFFRKSLKVGPLRFNLSKSGIGASVGVKGARIGVNARGNTYVAGGRYGLYYRKQLGSAPAPRTPLSIQRPSSSAGVVILVVAAIALALIGLALIGGQSRKQTQTNVITQPRPSATPSPVSSRGEKTRVKARQHKRDGKQRH
jgi:hypothetical protein